MTTRARANDCMIQADLGRRGIVVSESQARVLRRAAQTLHRWAEGECGDGNAYASWSIERDEATGVPYRVTYPHNGHTWRKRIADREGGALARVRALCEATGLYFYHQTDPRGASLYVGTEPLTSQNYSSRGVAV